MVKMVIPEAERLNSICFVVDTSGSMDGTPIQDAREALGQFLDQVTGNTELADVRAAAAPQAANGGLHGAGAGCQLHQRVR